MPPKRKAYDEDDDEDYVDGAEANTDDYIIDDMPSNKRGRKSGKLKGSTQLTSKAQTVISNEDSQSSYQDYSKSLILKPDHESRPIWITSDNLIFLEAFSPLYQQAYDFLVAIAEPESRPEYIHTYRLTENSLYAAVAVSIDTESIIKVLNRLCKTDVPQSVCAYIRECTYTFGKAKIVLKNNNYFVESQHPEILRELLKNPNISKYREVVPADAVLGGDGFVQDAAPLEDSRNLDYTKLGADMAGEEDDEDDEDDGTVVGSTFSHKRQTVSFMLSKDMRAVQSVKRSAKEESRYPLMEEYDFKNDRKNPLLAIDLRPSTRIRVSTPLRFAKLLTFFDSILSAADSLIRKNRCQKCSGMAVRALASSCCPAAQARVSQG